MTEERKREREESESDCVVCVCVYAKGGGGGLGWREDMFLLNPDGFLTKAGGCDLPQMTKTTMTKINKLNNNAVTSI